MKRSDYPCFDEDEFIALAYDLCAVDEQRLEIQRTIRPYDKICENASPYDAESCDPGAPPCKWTGDRYREGDNIPKRLWCDCCKAQDAKLAERMKLVRKRTGILQRMRNLAKQIKNGGSK